MKERLYSLSVFILLLLITSCSIHFEDELNSECHKEGKYYDSSSRSCK